MTAECLEILSSELKPLKEAEANGGLLPQVLCCDASSHTLRHTHERFKYTGSLLAEVC